MMKIMPGKKELGMLLLLALGLYFLLVFFGGGQSKAEHPEFAKAVFRVS